MTTTRPPRILFIVVSVICLLAAGEVIFRGVVLPDYRDLSQDMVVSHPVYGWYNRTGAALRRYSPNNYDVVNVTNTLGLRGFEADRDRELGGIWVGGGSNTFGGGLENKDTYGYRLRDFGYVAANLACEGHSVARQILVIRHLLSLGYKPKAVILETNMESALEDFMSEAWVLTKSLESNETQSLKTHSDAFTPSQQATNDVNAILQRVPRSLIQIRSVLIGNSAIYGALKISMMESPVLRDLTLRYGLRSDVATTLKFGRDYLEPIAAGSPVAGKLDSNAEFIALVRDFVEKQIGVPFGLVVLPAYHQIRPDLLEYALRYHGLNDEGLDPSYSFYAFVDALRRRGVNVLPMDGPLKAAAIQKLTFPDDAHLTAEGHAVVSAALGHWLRADIGIAPIR